MSRLAPLIACNVRNNYRLKPAVLASMLALAAFFIATLIVLVCLLAILPQARSARPDLVAVERYLALIVYGSGFIAMGMNVNIFTANPLVREKAQRLHESILGSPVGVRELWLAKSLAVFLPGVALCEIAAIGSFIGIEAFVIAPRMGFLASPQLLINALALVPILYFPLCLLVILVGLAGNPVSGNVIANIAFSATIAVAMNLVTRAGMDVGSLAFALGHLGLAALLGIIVLFLQRRLSKERVVLSCRT